MKQVVSDYEGDDLYAPELLERLAKAFSPEDVQLYYQTAITGRRDLRAGAGAAHGIRDDAAAHARVSPGRAKAPAM